MGPPSREARYTGHRPRSHKVQYTESLTRSPIVAHTYDDYEQVIYILELIMLRSESTEVDISASDASFILNYVCTVLILIDSNSVTCSCFVVLLPREAMLSVVYAVVVCLCVCLSHSGIVSKRLNVGSRKQRRTIAP